MLTKGVIEIEMPLAVEANNIAYLEFPDAAAATTGQINSTWDAYIDDWLDEVLPVISTVVTFARVLIYVVDLLDGSGVLLSERSIARSGSAATGMLPHGVAIKSNFKVAGRARPSSFYLPGVTYGQLDSDGSFNGTVIGAVLGGSNVWQTPRPIVGGTGNANPVYWSQKDLAFYSLQNAGIQLNDIPDYQRRRKPGVGS